MEEENTCANPFHDHNQGKLSDEQLTAQNKLALAPVLARATPGSRCESPSCEVLGPIRRALHISAKGKHLAEYAVKVTYSPDALEAAAIADNEFAALHSEQGMLFCSCCMVAITAMMLDAVLKATLGEPDKDSRIPTAFERIPGTKDVNRSTNCLSKAELYKQKGNAIKAQLRLAQMMQPGRGGSVMSAGSLAIDMSQAQHILDSGGPEALKRFVAEQVGESIAAEIAKELTTRANKSRPSGPQPISNEDVKSMRELLWNSDTLPDDIGKEKLN